MTTEVTIEHFPGEKFRVSGTGRFAVTAEGDTKAEALANFEARAAHTAPFFEVITVEIPVSHNDNHAHTDAPTEGNAKLLASIGTGADISDEFKARFLETIERNRQEENARQVD